MIIFIWPHNLLLLSYSETLTYVLSLLSVVGVIRHDIAQKLFLTEKEKTMQTEDIFFYKSMWADTVVPTCRRPNSVCLTRAVQRCALLPAKSKHPSATHCSAPIACSCDPAHLWTFSWLSTQIHLRSQNRFLSFPRNYFSTANKACVNVFWLLQSSWSNSYIALTENVQS